MPDSLQIVQSKFPKVRRVVNAKRSVPFTVTPKHARDGKPKDHWNCSAALACVDELDVDGAMVSTRTAYLIKGDTATRYAIGSAVNREVTSLDRGAGFAPGQYTLLKPQRTMPRGSGTRHAGDPAPGKLKHAAYPHVEGTRAALSSFLPAPKGRKKRH